MMWGLWLAKSPELRIWLANNSGVTIDGPLKLRSVVCSCICPDGVCLIFTSCNFKITAAEIKCANLPCAGARRGLQSADWRSDGVTESGARLNISSRELTLMLKLTATVIKPTVGKLNIILFLEILWLFFGNKIWADAASVQIWNNYIMRQI